jgi:hypothetical protein
MIIPILVIPTLKVLNKFKNYFLKVRLKIFCPKTKKLLLRELLVLFGAGKLK